MENTTPTPTANAEVENLGSVSNDSATTETKTKTTAPKQEVKKENTTPTPTANAEVEIEFLVDVLDGDTKRKKGERLKISKKKAQEIYHPTFYKEI